MVMLDTMTVGVIPVCWTCSGWPFCIARLSDELLDGELPDPLLLELPEPGELAEPDDIAGVVLDEPAADRVPVTRTR